MDRVSLSSRRSILRRRRTLARLVCHHAAVGLIAGSLVSTSTAFADFPTSTPNSGDTLTSTGGSTGINAPNATGVTLNISGPVDPGTSPAIDIGRGVTINVTGAGELFSTPPGPASTYTVPDLFAPGVVDEASLNAALLPVIGQNSPFGSFNSPLIRLGAGGDISSDIAGLTSVVTVAKAGQADQAMNTITDYINGGGYTPPVGLAVLLGNTVNSADSNQINNQGAIASAGSSGIFGLGGSANRIVIDGGVLGTEANNSTGYLLGGSGASEIVLINNGGIATVFNGSPAIDGGGAGSATGVQILDSVVYTLGNSSAAINGGVATNSVFALEVRGRASRLPTIGTFGDNSAGVVFRGAGNSTATVDIAGVTSNAFGAGMRTLGNNSTLFDFDTTINGGSSLTFSAIDSSFATAGNNSRVISMLAGDVSDILIFLSEVQIASTGTNAGLITFQGGQSSIANFVGIDLDLTSTGNGSGGIVLLTGMGDVSSMTTFLADSTVSTLGNDAPALFLEAHGNTSSRTINLLNDTFSTTGDRSAGVWLGGLGNFSAMDDSADSLNISTAGNDSPGYVSGALGNNSAKTTSIANTTISTLGNNSTALEIGGIIGPNSVASFDVSNPIFQLQGMTHLD